jgi:hypothetical protein
MNKKKQRETGVKQTVMTKGRVDNRDVWGFKEENHSTSSSSLLYCKTKHRLKIGIIERLNIDTHHKGTWMISYSFYLQTLTVKIQTA